MATDKKRITVSIDIDLYCYVMENKGRLSFSAFANELLEKGIEIHSEETELIEKLKESK